MITQRVAHGERACSAETGAYCQAHKRLPAQFFSSLASRLGRDLNARLPSEWLWKGRRVYLFDGSTVSMPDTPANQHAYPQHDAQRPGLGFPIARTAAIFSLSCGAILDLGVCRYAGKGQRLGKGDHLVRWPKPTTIRSVDWPTYRDLPDSVTVRQCRVVIGQAGFRSTSIIVVATLLDPDEFTRDDLLTLYGAHWNAELDLPSVKTTMQMVAGDQTPTAQQPSVRLRAIRMSRRRTISRRQGAAERLWFVSARNRFTRRETCPREDLHQSRMTARRPSAIAGSRFSRDGTMTCRSGVTFSQGVACQL